MKKMTLSGTYVPYKGATSNGGIVSTVKKKTILCATYVPYKGATSNRGWGRGI